MIDIINLKWRDNVQAVWLDKGINNIPGLRTDNEPLVDAQTEIYAYRKIHSY